MKHTKVKYFFFNCTWDTTFSVLVYLVLVKDFNYNSFTYYCKQLMLKLKVSASSHDANTAWLLIETA